MESKRENQANHLKNLHGGNGVNGLYGRWRGVWYEDGKPRMKPQPLTTGYVPEIKFVFKSK